MFFDNQHRTKVVGSMGLQHKPWLLTLEGGVGGIGWQLHGFLNAKQSCSAFKILKSHDCQTESGRVYLLSWKIESDLRVAF